MDVYLNYYSTTVSTILEEGPWGSSERETTYHDVYLSKVKGLNYDTLTIPDGITGEVHYCYSTHNSGDSFNSNTGEYIELLFVCTSKVDAERAYDAIYKADNSQITVSLDGKDVDIYLPWFGYFESLHELYLETTTL